MKFKDVLRETFQTIEEQYQGVTFRRGALSTGCVGLDVTSGGLVAGELTLVASRPASGKTSLAVSAAHATARAGKVVLFASLQWPRADFAYRMLALESEVDLEHLAEDRMEDGDWPKLTRAAGTLAETPLHVEDANPAGVADVKRWAEALAARDGLDLVVVDHLGRLGDGTPGAMRDDARKLRAFARGFAVPVLAAVELPPTVDARHDPRPRIGDLEDLGIAVADTDGVWLVFRPELHGGPRGVLQVTARRSGGFTLSTQIFRCGSSLRFVSAVEVAPTDDEVPH